MFSWNLFKLFQMIFPHTHNFHSLSNHENCYHSTALALKLWTKLHIVCNTIEDVCTAEECWESFKGFLFLVDAFVIIYLRTEYLHYFMAIVAWNYVSDNNSRIWDYFYIFYDGGFKFMKANGWNGDEFWTELLRTD